MTTTCVVFLMWIVLRRDLDNQDQMLTHVGERRLCNWGCSYFLQGWTLWWCKSLPGHMNPKLCSPTSEPVLLQQTARAQRREALLLSEAGWGEQGRKGQFSLMTREQWLAENCVTARIKISMRCLIPFFLYLRFPLDLHYWGQDERVALYLTDTNCSGFCLTTSLQGTMSLFPNHS